MKLTKDEAQRMGIFEEDGGYIVVVWERGYVHLCEYDNEKKRWRDCVFSSIEEAYEARERYYGRR